MEGKALQETTTLKYIQNVYIELPVMCLVILVPVSWLAFFVIPVRTICTDTVVQLLPHNYRVAGSILSSRYCLHGVSVHVLLHGHV